MRDCTRPSPSRRSAAWMTAAFAFLLVAVMAVLVVRAPHAEARPASRGYFAEAGAGAVGFYGTGGDYSKIGLSFELRTGYDLVPWLSLGVFLATSTHEAAVPPPPEGEYFQIYTGGGDLRLSYLFDRFGVFLDGGLGIAKVSSNILSKVDILDPGQEYSLALRAGAGVEYQLQNRHYAVGLAGQWVSLPYFESLGGVSARLYVRYTY